MELRLIIALQADAKYIAILRARMHSGATKCSEWPQEAIAGRTVTNLSVNDCYDPIAEAADRNFRGGVAVSCA